MFSKGEEARAQEAGVRLISDMLRAAGLEGMLPVYLVCVHPKRGYVLLAHPDTPQEARPSPAEWEGLCPTNPQHVEHKRYRRES